MKAVCQHLRANPNLCLGIFGALLMFGPPSFLVMMTLGLVRALRAFPQSLLIQQWSGLMLNSTLGPLAAKVAATMACLGLFFVGFSTGRACWKRWPKLGE